MGLQAPRLRSAEVYINYAGRPVTAGDYAGVYWVTETIKNNSVRTNLKQLHEDDRMLPQISGGYIFKFDQAAAEEPELTCSGSGRFQAAVVQPDPERCRVFLEQRAGGPAAHRYRPERAGPLWDYNFSLAIGGAASIDPMGGWQFQGSRNVNDWYPKLTADAAFMGRLKARWAELRRGSLADAARDERIDELMAPLKNAAARDLAKWPVSEVLPSGAFVRGPSATIWDGQVARCATSSTSGQLGWTASYAERRRWTELGSVLPIRRRSVEALRPQASSIPSLETHSHEGYPSEDARSS